MGSGWGWVARIWGKLSRVGGVQSGEARDTHHERDQMPPSLSDNPLFGSRLKSSSYHHLIAHLRIT